MKSELDLGSHELHSNYKYIFLFSEYGVKLAKDDLFANILPNMLELTDYEEQYMTPEERKHRGFQVKVAKSKKVFSKLFTLQKYKQNYCLPTFLLT